MFVKNFLHKSQPLNIYPSTLSLPISYYYFLTVPFLQYIRYPVTLKAGWYCALVSPRYVTSVLFVHTNDTVNNTFVDRNDLTIEYNDSAQETLAIKGTFLLFGIALLVVCNASIAFELHKRPFRDAASREMDRKFACIMGVVAVLFLLTWFPNLVSISPGLETLL